MKRYSFQVERDTVIKNPRVALLEVVRADVRMNGRQSKNGLKNFFRLMQTKGLDKVAGKYFDIYI